MSVSRRDFLKKAASASVVGVPSAIAEASHPEDAVSREQILEPFAHLPGDKGIKVFVPGAPGADKLSVQINPNHTLFAASAIKTYVLCEALRQADSPEIEKVLEAKKLALDASVWSFGSPTFTPNDLSGIVSERTTLEAMITRSDNTATDMILNLVGAHNVRAFLAAQGLEHTLVPDSTRALTAYVFGARDYKTITWEELEQLVTNGQPIHPFLNNVETLASSAGDLVSYYSRALQGEFFKHRETLNEFRRILTLCDFIYLIPVPLGVSVYAKSGNADAPDFHARSFAGGMFVAGRWAYFAFIINWYAPEGEDPETVSAFFAAIHHTLDVVKRWLTRERPDER